MILRDAPSFPSITLCNAQSLLPKIDEVRAVISLKSSTIVCITETWLNDNVDSSLLSIPGYSLSRCDRSYRRGGGTAVYIKSHLIFSIVSVTSFNHSDCCVIDITTTNLLLACIYIPPNVRADDLYKIHEMLVMTIDEFLSCKPHYDYVILGDFNQFDVQSLCRDLNLYDLINRPTRGNNILDHILVSFNLKEKYASTKVDYDCPIGKADHLMITCHPVKGEPIVSVSNYRCVMDLRESHVKSLFTAVSQINWTDIMTSDADIDSQWNAFLTCLKNLIDTHIPMHFVRMTDNDKEWLTPLTKLLIQERWNAYRSRDWEKFHHFKNKVKKEIFHAKLIWANKMKKSANGLWKLVKNVRSLNQNKDPLSKLLLSEGDSVQNLLEKLRGQLTECFAPVSSSTYSRQTLDLQTVEDSGSIWSIYISEESVRRLLSRLSPSKAAGSDGIPTRIYRHLADVIALPLTMIFRASINQQAVPGSWKRGVIVPVPKTNPPSLGKLRFITLLPVPLKILERLILRDTWKHFETSYGFEQHGFRPGASTTTALVRLTDSALSCINDPSKFGLALISFDLTRAFDTVDSQLAVNKMKESGFPTGFLRWLSSYLNGRSAIIKIKDCFSKEFSIFRGVPQGSVLGPPIFCAYVGSIRSSTLGVTTVKYADDITMTLPLQNSDPKVIKLAIDREVEHITNLCTAHHLILNTEKSKTLLISRRKISFVDPLSLPQVQSLRILGIVVNDRLNWSSHVDSVCKKGAQRLHVIRKLRDLISPAELHLVYCSIIRSILEYASPIFVGLNKKLSDRIQKIDKRAHRIMSSNSRLKDYACNCDASTLSDRRHKAAERLFRSIETSPGHLLFEQLPVKLLRSRQFSVPFSTSDKYHNSFFPYMVRYLNSKNCRR
jgi:exonuclease III